MVPQIMLIVAAAALAAAGEVPETPDGQWRVDYGESQCVAMRTYGERVLAFRSAPNGESYEIILIEPGTAGEFARQSDGSVAFSGAPIRTTVLVSSDRKLRKKFFKYRLTAAEIEEARSAGRIVLRARRTDIQPTSNETRILKQTSAGSANFALTHMDAVIAQMEKCTADLRAYWNDIGHSTVIAVPATGDIRGLFNSDDYPSEAMRREQGGTTRTILLIDEKGKVASCYNSLPSGIATVDAMSCQVIIERAKFQPARDSSGRPVRSIHYSPRITFRLGA